MMMMLLPGSAGSAGYGGYGSQNTVRPRDYAPDPYAMGATEGGSDGYMPPMPPINGYGSGGYGSGGYGSGGYGNHGDSGMGGNVYYDGASGMNTAQALDASYNDASYYNDTSYQDNSFTDKSKHYYGPQDWAYPTNKNQLYDFSNNPVAGFNSNWQQDNSNRQADNSQRYLYLDNSKNIVQPEGYGHKESKDKTPSWAIMLLVMMLPQLLKGFGMGNHQQEEQNVTVNVYNELKSLQQQVAALSSE
jgi:hypothetical protein